MATMSCDVNPGGLSTSRTPSGAGFSVGLRPTLLDLREERLDTGRSSDALVVTKENLRCRAQAKGFPEARAQMAGETIQSFECRLPVRVRSEDADEHLS